MAFLGAFAKFGIWQRKNKGNKDAVDALTGEGRWSFKAYKPVFHHNDRVRLFVKHPYREHAWYPAFTGFLTTHNATIDPNSGQQRIDIQAQDIRHIMDKMRVRVNPLIESNQITPEPLFTKKSGIFRDLELNPRLTHILGGQTFEQAMDFLLTGSTESLNLTDDTKRGSTFGVGQLERGRLYAVNPQNENTFSVSVSRFNPARNGASLDVNASLEGWQDLMLFGSNEEPIPTEEMLDIAYETYTGGTWDPIRGKVHYLLPAQESSYGELTTYSAVGANFTGSFSRSWQTRLSLVQEVCQKIGYQWKVTGLGDVAFEFPMMDFLPEHFGRYQSAMEVRHQWKSAAISPESGNIVTALTATGGWANTDQSQIPQGAKNPEVFMPKAWVIANVLAARVGANVDTVSYPFVYDTRLLCLFTMVEFFRRLANATTSSAEIAYRLPLDTNRPLHIVPLKRMANIQSLAYSLDVQAGMGTMTLTMDMLRFEGEDGSYRFITGGKAAPITYRNFNSVGFLINADSGVASKCSTGPETRQLTQTRQGALASSGSPHGGLTRDQIREIAAKFGATEEAVIIAITINSEDPAGTSAARQGIAHTLLNRVGAKKDKASDLWSAANGRNKTTGHQGGRNRAGNTAGRPYSTARPPTTDAKWKARIAEANTAIAENRAGNDPTNGATRFMHPGGFKAKDGRTAKQEFRRVLGNWKGEGYQTVPVQGTSGSRIVFLKHPKNER